MHATFYVFVNIILITVDLLTPVLPVPFAAARPVIGLTVNYLFGVHWIGEERQASIERRAAQEMFVSTLGA